MAYVVTATWTVTDGNEEIVLDSLKKLTPASRAEPGCQYYQAYHDPADPRVFRLFEVYDDEAAYQAHGASDVTDDRLDLEMSVDVNGVRLGSDRSANMAWSFAELVAYAWRSSWVRAGDVIASGTCASGALAEHWGRSGWHEPPPLKPGDVVTMTIGHIGSIENTVVEGVPEASPIVPARRRLAGARS